ncbi:MAG: class I SAM-dependent methyltransferase [Methylacidiphilales bacterium]|nr:class I SAM-dependent methyltransferase [Candidatus Methylacidiphilales bacterium]
MSALNEIQQASKEQFDRQSANYGSSHILSNTEDLRSTLQFLKPLRGQTLLDVACGAGHTGLYFARLGLEVTLTDISTSMLEKASQAAAAEGIAVTVREHAAEQFPYPDQTFDIVTCRVAAHHFSCPATFLMETARVLKPHGRFLLIDGSVEDGQPEAEEWMHQVEKLRDPSHNRFITPLKWMHLCGHVGLRVVHREIQPFKQPDLEWYFQTAGTTPENRAAVLKLIDEAPESARRLFKLGREDGRIVWWWQRLVLIAEKL